RDYYEPVRDLSLQLSAHMLVLANKAQTLQEGLSMAGGLLESGRALSAFRRLLEYQGPAQLDQMPKAKYSYEFTAEDVGYIHSIDTQKLGWTGVALGAGRRRSSDRIDVTAGLEFLCCVGDRVEKGQPLV